MRIAYIFRISSLTFILTIFTGFYPHSMQIMAQDSAAVAEKLQIIANAIIEDATFHFVDKQTGQSYVSTKKVPSEAQLEPESPYTDWRYWNGVLNIAMIRLGDVFHKPAYTDFAVKNIAFSFDNYSYFENRYNNQGKWSYPFGQYFIMEELDDCGAMGASVIEVYRRDPRERYKTYIEKAAQHILEKQDRITDGTLVRSFPVKWTLWADDLYMGLSFLARMGKLSGENHYFDDAAKQVINFHNHLFDEQEQLMHHCWYSDVDRPGVAFWGRANGWALLAQIDLLDFIPADHPQRDTLITLLQRHILGIAQYQGGQGLWHQLLNKVDSYLETSCSAMFTYTIARAINKGYIEPRYSSIAIRGWEGIMSKIRQDGKVEGVCTGTGVSNDLVHYYQRPTPLNDIHGIGAVILAGIEVIQLSKISE